MEGWGGGRGLRVGVEPMEMEGLGMGGARGWGANGWRVRGWGWGLQSQWKWRVWEVGGDRGRGG